ncbi:MAG: DEAD/DEAH box helicase, partial [Planctomycetaceae bacterium]|nr:DEAD/DEAH box helicase [Planctomycetaceae bacterium]
MVTVLSVAPAVLLMTTSFLRISVVLGLLRQALGTQQNPSNQVIGALALFMSALIMTPTRELARQVLGVVNQLLGKSNTIRSACLIGGEAMGKQLNQLRKGPRIIVGTPGRINDHLESETLDLMDCGYLVLDETD